VEVAMIQIQFAITASLGLLLLTTAVVKLRGLTAFRAAVAGYQVLPTPLVGPVAWFVPLAECAVGLALLAGWGTAAALRTAAALFVVFAAAMAQVLAGGRRPSCGCGIGAQRRISWAMVARNVALAELAIGSSFGTPSPGLRALLSPRTALSRDAAIAVLITLAALALTWRTAQIGIRIRARLRELAVPRP
jgi:hypothetical protein